MQRAGLCYTGVASTPIKGSAVATPEFERNRLSPATLLALIDAQRDLARIGPDFTAVMDMASAEAARLTGAEGAVIELLEGEEIVYRAACGLAEPQLGLRMAVKGSLSGLCLTSKSAAICHDSEEDARVNVAACRRVGLRSMVIVPLLFGEHAAGVLKLLWSAPRPFDQDEAAIARILADMIAALMHHAALQGEDQLRRQVTRDAASGAANRSFLYEQLRARLDEAEKKSGHVGIMLMRIDGLDRGTRERLGNEFPQMLAEIVRRLSAECRPSDVIGRIGLNEFAVIFSVAGRRSVVQSQVTRIGQMIASRPLLLQQKLSFDLSLNFGHALYPEDGTGLMEFMGSAQAALAACPDQERRDLSLRPDALRALS
nr:diguanylate cyclase [Massilia sp. YIM B04103]